MDTDDTDVKSIAEALAEVLESVRVELREESLRELELHFSERAERRMERLIAEAIRLGFDRASITAPDVSVEQLEVMVLGRRLTDAHEGRSRERAQGLARGAAPNRDARIGHSVSKP